MKKQKEKETVVGIRMTESEVTELDKFAERLRINRSQLIRNLIVCGIDDLKLAQTFGLISLISFIRQNNIKPQEIINLAMEKQGV
jgi:metal-responsive CopG/Arc/MetJ family transcriptional regulator